MLDTMTEITRILYAKVEERCQKSVLRLHNQTFLHAIACEEVIGKPIILTEKKFYGRYLHSLVCHAPIQHRIICSRSTNTEQQERHFNTFASISLSTSSRRPGEIITPGLIRMQAEMKQTDVNRRSTIQEQESRLGKLSKCLPKAENSIIPHRVIIKYQSAYQAHLEHVSDFLLCGEGIWWRHIAKGVEFFDVTSQSETHTEADTLPPLHHFRSHTLKTESKYLQDNWKKCVSLAAVQIPHHAIRVFDEMGDLDHIIYTGFLQDDEDDDENETECNGNEELSDAGSEDYADVNKPMDHENDDAGNETDKEEEEVIGLVQMGENILGQINQGKGLEELNKDEEDTRVIINEELPTTVENHEISHTCNDNDSSLSSLSSTLAKNVAKVIGETDDVKKLDRARNNLRKNLNSKDLQAQYETELAHVQSLVLRKHSEVTKSFKEWEKLFTTGNDCLEPTLEDIEKDKEGCNLYKTLRLSRQLLKHWKITVHL